MQAAQVVIATITLARTPAEEDLLRSSLLRLVSLGMPVIAADGGSPAAFTKYLASLRIKLVKSKRPGLVSQVEASIAASARTGRPFILYTEPDKKGFFEGPMLDFLRAVKPSRKMGVAMAARDARGFRTFPPAQRKSEQFINDVAADVFGSAGDYCYGPLIFPAGLAREVRGLSADLGWGWRFHLMRRAHEVGLKLAHVPLPVACPPDQRRESGKDRIYRYKQLRQNLQGTLS